MDFQIAFDLTTHPQRIQPAWAIYALFLVVGLGLLAVGILVRRRPGRFKFLLGFGLVWLCGVTFLTFKDIEDISFIREQVERGAYATVEGCLDYFHPGSPEGTKTTTGNERWSVGGTGFDYGQGQFRPGYHLVEPRGGAVHRRSRVRVSFVTSRFTGRREIVRLAVARYACPAAPDIGS